VDRRFSNLSLSQAGLCAALWASDEDPIISHRLASSVDPLGVKSLKQAHIGPLIYDEASHRPTPRSRRTNPNESSQGGDQRSWSWRRSKGSGRSRSLQRLRKDYRAATVETNCETQTTVTKPRQSPKTGLFGRVSIGLVGCERERMFVSGVKLALERRNPGRFWRASGVCTGPSGQLS
jgi:hypothetical protein